MNVSKPTIKGPYVAVLEKGMRVLNAFAVDDVWLGSTEIASRAGLPKATAARFANSLAMMNYLHYSPRRRKFRLGIGVLSLGYEAQAELSITYAAQHYLHVLADKYGVHASLGARDRTDVIQLAVCHSSNTLMTLRLEVGSRIPLAGTAMGHALLGAMPEAERTHIMEYLAQRHHKHWSEIKKNIERGIQEIERHGYTTSQRGWSTDINGVAAPLIIPGETEALVLACGAPARHLPQKTMIMIGKELVENAKKIAEDIK